MNWSSPVAALALVGGVLAVGSYVVAVLDAAGARMAAGRPVQLWDTAATPVRRAALLALTQRSATERPDAQAWALAPALLMAMAAAGVALVPWGRGVVVADLDEGIVAFGAAMATVMVAVYLHGWSANSALPLIGGYRFIALALSYEMPLALVLIAAALPAQSLSLGEIVASQEGLWNVVRQPLGLPLYLVAGLGLAFWEPLNLADGPDLSGGTTAEVSGPDRLVWALARHCVVVAVAAVGAATFLGGWWGPVLPGPVWMALKTLALAAVVVGLGHRVARVRLERFVVVAWTVLIPLALVDVFLSGALAL
ncbi:MAG: NADH-quinone oxidoreductase subunit H [Acidimicrobiales bacterium]